MVEVVGNLRFFTTVFGSLLIMVMGSKWISWPDWFFIGLGWIGFNFVLDLTFRAVLPRWRDRPRFTSPVSMVGDVRYMIFLLLMAGFWTSFNQLFITVPEYIRDYTDTGDLVRSLSALGINLDPSSTKWFDNGKIKPEYLINLNAFGIICLQVLISYLARNVRPLVTIVSGIIVTVLSFLVFLGGAQGWFVVAAILVFSVGEMLASPKSKEYAGRIAPPDKVGMYMGYFYWCTALGNLFGGIVSGQSYQHFGPAGVNDPDKMWWLFSGLALVTAVALVIYNRWVGGERDTD
jgi:dipeptide/tripeptide permease